MPFALKSHRVSATIPGELWLLVKDRITGQKYNGISELIFATLLWDVLVSADHIVTGPLFREPEYSRDAIICELLNEKLQGKKIKNAKGEELIGLIALIVEKRVAARLDEERKKEPSKPKRKRSRQP